MIEVIKREILFRIIPDKLNPLLCCLKLIIENIKPNIDGVKENKV